MNFKKYSNRQDWVINYIIIENTQKFADFDSIKKAIGKTRLFSHEVIQN
jgi:hypothetical protein